MSCLWLRRRTCSHETPRRLVRPQRRLPVQPETNSTERTTRLQCQRLPWRESAVTPRRRLSPEFAEAANPTSSSPTTQACSGRVSDTHSRGVRARMQRVSPAARAKADSLRSHQKQRSRRSVAAPGGHRGRRIERFAPARGPVPSCVRLRVVVILHIWCVTTCVRTAPCARGVLLLLGLR